MSATYTWDVFSTVDGYGSYADHADWGGYWSKQGPEFLDHRAAIFDTPQRMIFGATTFRETAEIMAAGTDPNALDEWNARTMRMPATVISSTLDDTPVISGRTGTSPILRGADDFDLDLLESRTLDGRTLEVVYHPSPR